MKKSRRQLVDSAHELMELGGRDVIHAKHLIENAHPTMAGVIGKGLLSDVEGVEILAVMKIVEDERRDRGTPIAPLIRLCDYYFDDWPGDFTELEIRKCIPGCLAGFGCTVGFMVAEKYPEFTEMQLRFDRLAAKGHADYADDKTSKTSEIIGIDYASENQRIPLMESDCDDVDWNEG